MRSLLLKNFFISTKDEIIRDIDFIYNSGILLESPILLIQYQIADCYSIFGRK